MTTDLRPDPRIEQRLRSAFDAVVPHLADDDADAAGIDGSEAQRPRPRGRFERPWTAAAAAVLIAAAVGSLVILAGRRTDDGDVGTPVDTVPATVEPTVPPVAEAPVAFVVDDLPAGFAITRTGLAGPVARTDPSTYVSNEFGTAADPLDPARMVHIEFAPSASQTLTCFAAEGEPGITEVADTTFANGIAGRVCRVDGLLEVDWTLDGVGFRALGGSAVTAADLAQLVGSLAFLAIEPPATGAPPVRLELTGLSPNWVPLVTGDAPYDQQIVEANWVATEGGTDGASSSLLVSTRTGLDEEYAALVRHSAIQAERVTVRDHEGYRYVSSQQGALGPLEIQVWWVEQPGVVVSVTATDLPADEVMALVESLRPVDAGGAAAFFGHSPTSTT